MTENEAFDIQCKARTFMNYSGAAFFGAIAYSPKQGKWYYLKLNKHAIDGRKKISANNIIRNGNPIENLKAFHAQTNQIDQNHGTTLDGEKLKHKYKKLVIIGAGASYDYKSKGAATNLIAPPLTKDIFDGDILQLMNQRTYRGVQNLASELASTSNLEKYFHQKWQELQYTFNPSLLSELMNVQFYLHHFFLSLSHSNYKNSFSNYSIIANKIHDYCLRKKEDKEGILVVSYNYDTLFEQAIEKKYRKNIETIEDYLATNERPVTILKPHGSSDWVKVISKKYAQDIGLINSNFRAINSSTIAQTIYDNNLNLIDLKTHFESSIQLIHKIEFDNSNKTKYNNASSRYSGSLSEIYWPHLLIPYHEKDEFVMPKAHEIFLTKVLPQVEEILIIGWKGEEKKISRVVKETCIKKGEG